MNHKAITSVVMPTRIAVHALNDFAASQGCKLVKTVDGFALQPNDPYANVLGLGRVRSPGASSTPAPGGDSAA